MNALAAGGYHPRTTRERSINDKNKRSSAGLPSSLSKLPLALIKKIPVRTLRTLAGGCCWLNDWDEGAHIS